MKGIIIAIVAAVILVTGGFFLYIKGSPKPSSSGLESNSMPSGQTVVPAPSEPTSDSPSSGQTANVKEITIEGKNFSFSPSSVTVNKGDKVKVIFKNVMGNHDLVIDELGVATNRISGGEQDIVEFAADKAGTFEYYCSVGEHRAMGMRGTLLVK